MQWTLSYIAFFILCSVLLPLNINILSAQNIHHFYKNISRLKPPQFDGQDVCTTSYQKYAFKDSGPISKKDLYDIESTESVFWTKTFLSLKLQKFKTYEEIVTSHIFYDLLNIFENLYCLGYLGHSDLYQKWKKKLSKILSNLEDHSNVYVYYDDGLSGKLESIIIVYIQDGQSGNLYSIKSVLF